MIDQLESMEIAAENQYYDMLQPDGGLKCGCGQIFDESEGMVLSPNPYAMPSCPKCFDKYIKELEKQDD